MWHYICKFKDFKVSLGQFMGPIPTVRFSKFN